MRSAVVTCWLVMGLVPVLAKSPDLPARPQVDCVMPTGSALEFFEGLPTRTTEHTPRSNSSPVGPKDKAPAARAGIAPTTRGPEFSPGLTVPVNRPVMASRPQTEEPPLSDLSVEKLQLRVLWEAARQFKEAVESGDRARIEETRKALDGALKIIKSANEPPK